MDHAFSIMTNNFAQILDAADFLPCLPLKPLGVNLDIEWEA